MFKLTKLRKDLEFNKEIGNIVDVLRGVASSEFYRLKTARKELDEFGDYLQGFFRMVNIGGAKHPLIETSELPSTILIITSDIGFLGKLNVSVVNSALTRYSGDEKLIIVGRQGLRYIDEKNVKIKSFPGITDEVEYLESEQVGKYIMYNFIDKKIGGVVVFYPHFVSFGLWEVQNYQLLPCQFLFPDDVKSEEEDIILEPSLPRVLEYLAQVWINYMLYAIFWESKLSEWSERVIHLEGSSNEIKRTNKSMRSRYFRLIHELSDKNVREIFASRLGAR